MLAAAAAMRLTALSSAINHRNQLHASPFVLHNIRSIISPPSKLEAAAAMRFTALFERMSRPDTCLTPWKVGGVGG